MRRVLQSGFRHKLMVFLPGLWAMSGVAVADTVFVNPDGMEDYTTIQDAIDDLPNPGPRMVIVRAGTYNESVKFWRKNMQATTDAERIVIMADPEADAGSVIVYPGDLSGGDESDDRRHPSEIKHAFRLGRSKYITIRGFAIAGATKTAIALRGGNAANSDVTLENNDIYDNGLGCGNCAAISVGRGNARTWVVNNLIRHNGRNGLWDGDEDDGSGAGDQTYIVNNTFFANGWNGVTISGEGYFYLINNLFVGNGAASSHPPAPGQRWGLKVEAEGQGYPERITLISNMFFENGMFFKDGPGNPPMKGGDIANVAQTLNSTDSGNWTTLGSEGPDADGVTPAVGIIGATAATSYSSIFVDPVGWDFHLADGSPAIDRGVGTYTHGAREWVPAEDFESETRPVDGDGQNGARRPTLATTRPCRRFRSLHMQPPRVGRFRLRSSLTRPWSGISPSSNGILTETGSTTIPARSRLRRSTRTPPSERFPQRSASATLQAAR